MFTKVCAFFLLATLVASIPTPDLLIAVEDAEINDHPEAQSGFFEGDIELPRFRNAIRNLNARWPSGTVYYSIDTTYPADVKATIVAAMREIESNTKHGSTNCIHFVERTNQHDFVYIQPHTGCHSKIGRSGGAQELSLGTGCTGKGTIMHELTHALGFWHEQNRYDRDTYVTIHTDNIASEHLHDFTKQSITEMNTQGSDYDFGSIMHYGAYTFAVDKSKPSISPNAGQGHDLTMGQRLAQSTADVWRIQKLYGCTIDTTHITRPSSSQDVVNCNFEHGLCELTQDHADNFDWTSKQGSTGTPLTGPTADHTNSAGFYIYAEANAHHHQRARLFTPTVSAGSYCIDFWFYMYGSTEGTFQVLAAGPSIHEQAAKTFSGNQRNEWTHVRINMNLPATAHFILQATIGSGDTSDIAVDDFNLYHGRCL